MIWKRHVTGPPVEAVVQSAQVLVATDMVICEPRTALTDPQRERLALALHERHHGTHVPDRGKVECARMSGAFDDVTAIEPEILALMRGGL